jgi:hypothetical protein
LNYFPGFTRKAISFTIDDGNVALDTKFINIVKPHGIKGTFNLFHTKWKDFSHDDYRALYDGFEIANHCKEHPFALRDGKEYTYSDEYYYDGMPLNNGVLYKTENPKILIEMTEEYWAHKKRIATNENYMALIKEAQEELQEVFGKGKIRGFVWPYGGQPNKALKAEIASCGLFYGMRTVGSPRENEDFSLPKNRMAWVYNAYHLNVLEMGGKFDKYEDDGTLKWLCFGVHSHDFESAGNWCDLEEFARKYGNRPNDFYYATNAEIFDYEDAVKSAVVTNDSVHNPSGIDLYIKIDDRCVVLKAGETIRF